MLCYAKSLQSCPTLCDPRDVNTQGTPVPGILQARTLEWAAISFSNAWKWKEKVKLLSRVRLLVIPWTAAHQTPLSMELSRKDTGVGSHSLFQGIFLTQGLNSGLLHCRQILYLLSHGIISCAKSLQSFPTLCDPIEGSPPGSPVPGILQARTLEWAAISFSNAWKWKVKVKSLSCVRLLATPWIAA